MKHSKGQYHTPLGYAGHLRKPVVAEEKRRFKRTLPPVTARALIHGCISAPEWSVKTFLDLGGGKGAIEFGVVDTNENKTVKRDDALTFLDLTLDEATRQ